ncbi:MAG: hypothetical protein QXI60_04750 [Thermofilaceae archaeon]
MRVSHSKAVSTALATIAIILVLILGMSWMAYMTVNAAQQAHHAGAAETAALKAKELVRVYIWLDPAKQPGGGYRNLTRISFVNTWSGETTINSLLIVWRDGRYEERPVSIRLGAGEDKTYLPSQLGLEGLDNYQAALERIKYIQVHTSLGNDFVSLWGRPDKPALYVTGTTRTDTYTVTRTSTTTTTSSPPPPPTTTTSRPPPPPTTTTSSPPPPPPTTTTSRPPPPTTTTSTTTQPPAATTYTITQTVTSTSFVYEWVATTRTVTVQGTTYATVTSTWVSTMVWYTTVTQIHYPPCVEWRTVVLDDPNPFWLRDCQAPQTLNQPAGAEPITPFETPQFVYSRTPVASLSLIGMLAAIQLTGSKKLRRTALPLLAILLYTMLLTQIMSLKPAQAQYVYTTTTVTEWVTSTITVTYTVTHTVTQMTTWTITRWVQSYVHTTITVTETGWWWWTCAGTTIVNYVTRCECGFGFCIFNCFGP